MTRPESGSATLEAALTLPVVAVLLLAVLQLTGVVRDELLVQEAARSALRVAVTTRTAAPVVTAAERAADGRPVVVRVVPGRRRPGDLVRVEVRLPGRVGPLRTTSIGRAAGRVEPGASG